jgi:hypothetical protein
MTAAAALALPERLADQVTLVFGILHDYRTMSIE